MTTLLQPPWHPQQMANDTHTPICFAISLNDHHPLATMLRHPHAASDKRATASPQTSHLPAMARAVSRGSDRAQPPQSYQSQTGVCGVMPALHAVAGEGAASSTSIGTLMPAGMDEAITSRAAAAPALVAAPAARRTSAAACNTAVEEWVTTEEVLHPALACAAASDIPT